MQRFCYALPTFHDELHFDSLQLFYLKWPLVYRFITTSTNETSFDFFFQYFCIYFSLKFVSDVIDIIYRFNSNNNCC